MLTQRRGFERHNAKVLHCWVKLGRLLKDLNLLLLWGNTRTHTCLFFYTYIFTSYVFAVEPRSALIRSWCFLILQSSLQQFNCSRAANPLLQKHRHKTNIVMEISPFPRNQTWNSQSLRLSKLFLNLETHCF